MPYSYSNVYIDNDGMFIRIERFKNSFSDLYYCLCYPKGSVLLVSSIPFLLIATNVTFVVLVLFRRDVSSFEGFGRSEGYKDMKVKLFSNRQFSIIRR